MVIYPFQPEGSQELWQFSAPWGIKNVSQVNAVLLGCFTDIEQTKEQAAYFENPANVEKLQNEMMAEYKKILKKNSGQTIKATNNTNLVDLNEIGAMQAAAKKITAMVYTATPGKYTFTPTVHNKEKIIILDKLNDKDLFPQNEAIEYAWFHLTLEHDPEDPYKIKF